MKSILITDSCCDLPLNYAKTKSEFLEVIGMPINIGAENFLDDLGDKNYTHPEFYNQLRSGIQAKTAQITPMDFQRIFKKYAQEERSMIYLGFSSGMSGTFNNAILAKNMLLDEYPNAHIHIIDSQSASIGQGLLCMKVVDLMEEGKPLEDIIDWVENHKQNVHHWFAVCDLMYLKNGGRIPPSIAAVGTLLNVKPILTVTVDGKLQSHSKVRGRKKSLRYLAQMVTQYNPDHSEPNILVAHGNCPEDAAKMKAFILEEHPSAQVHISEISATIATHVGPNMIAVVFMGKKRCI